MKVIKSNEVKKNKLKFVGFTTGEKAKKLSDKYFCLFTKNKDLINEVFEKQKRNIYVYIKEA